LTPQPQPAPQIARPQQRAPAIANRAEPPSSSPFVNPADGRNRALASDNYIWQNARKLSFFIDAQGREYHVGVRLVIARDGRLLSADVVASSGAPAIDQLVLAGIRKNSPYLPLPPEIGGDSATFLVPMGSVPRARY
jgi:protein TonB